MTHKTYSLVAGIIFLVVAICHLARALLQIPVLFGTASIPVGVSYLAFLVAAYLAWQGIMLGKRD